MVLFWSSWEDCWLDSCLEDDHCPTSSTQELTDKDEDCITLRQSWMEGKSVVEKRCTGEQGQAWPWDDGKMKPVQGYVGDPRRMGCSWGQCFKSHRAQLYPEGTPCVKSPFPGARGTRRMGRWLSGPKSSFLINVNFPVSDGLWSCVVCWCRWPVSDRVKGQCSVSRALQAFCFRRTGWSVGRSVLRLLSIIDRQ